MNKWIVVVMIAVMISVSVAGCGGKKTDSASQAVSEPQAVEAQAEPETQTETIESQEPETRPVPEADEHPAPEAVADELKDAEGGAEGSTAAQAESETASDAQPASPAGTQSEGQADAGMTAETAQPVEESRVPQAIRDLLVGEWQDMTSQRAGMDITGEDDANGKDFHAQIFWSGSYADRMVWDMDLEYDPVSGELTYKGGRKAEVTYGADGLIANEDVKWEDAEGSFTLTGGELRWKDSREEEAGNFVFTRVYAYDITAEEFSTNLFQVLTAMESGTAGSSLKQAQAAHEILSFAAGHQVWNVDAIARRAAINESWSGLSDDDKALVKKNFGGVADLLDKVYKDYESVSGTFEDAGVGEEMKAFSVNVYAGRSWKALRDMVKSLQ